MDFAGNVEPSGWLFCFGQAISRTGIYAQLFGVIGTLYGTGDGSTTFNLPDFRGRIGAGRDDMGGTAASRLTSAWSMDGTVLGANGGTESHVLTTPQIPSHSHTYGHLNGSGGAAAFAAGGAMVFDTPQTGSTGGGLAHPNVQPTCVVNKIIKYTVSGTVLPIVPGTGDVTGPNGGMVDGDLAVYNGTSGKILKSSSFFDALPAGSTVQTVYNETAVLGSGTTLIPLDDTIPQWTEGVLFTQMTTSITPRYANSQIIGRISGQYSTSVAVTCGIAVFRGTGPSAIAATSMTDPAINQRFPVSFTFQDLPGVITAVTYNLRFGPSAASTMQFNGAASTATRDFGGVSKTTFLLEEIKQ
jgi:microcystin-dependent protein